MPLSTAAKAALCLCPPAVMAGTVATVPAVKRAVHHLTAPHHPAKPAHRVARAAKPAKPGERVAQRTDCAPIVAGPLPVAPIVTYAAPIPPEPGVSGGPGGGSGGPGGGSPITVLAAESPIPVGTTPGNPGTNPPGGSTPAVPEPASWLLLIVGVGTMGVALRGRRRVVVRQAGTGAALWSIGGITEAGDTAASVAMQSGAAKSVLATAAGKAALCVCPAALVAGSVVAVPPIRHAVHTATAPAAIPAHIAPVYTPVPCDKPAAVPVSTTSVSGGYPAVVTTAPTS